MIMNETILKPTIKEIDVSKLVSNEGQVPGIPKNPRFITKDDQERLKKSIMDNPEMLELRELAVYEYEGSYVVMNGNQRLKVLQELSKDDNTFCGHTMQDYPS